MAEGGFGGRGAVCEDVGGCVAWCGGGEGGGATADLGGEWAALCEMEGFAAFEGV